MNQLPPGVRPQRHGPVPFAWRRHDDLPGVLEPVPDEQEALKQAFEYIDRGCTVTATARWLSATCGRRVGQNSLRRFYRTHQQEKESDNANQT